MSNPKHPWYLHLNLVGDEITDMLLPEEGKHRLTLSKSTESEEPLARIDAITTIGGVQHIAGLLREFNTPFGIAKASTKFNNLTHWHLKPRPKTLFDESGSRVYRVTERHLHTSSGENPNLFPDEYKEDPSRLDSNCLTIIADYNRQMSRSSEWNTYKDYLKSAYSNKIEKIILVGSQLPYAILRGRKLRGQPLWDNILSSDGRATKEQRNTLVIVSIDRLRQDGVKLSRRKSWDMTLEDFGVALNESPILKRLATFGHLVVRIGVSGAFYYRRVFDNSGKHIDHKLTMIYDPKAKAGIVRDLTSQGNVFGTRSAFAACIGKSLYWRAKDQSEEGTVLEAIGTAIKLSQFLYSEGFGDTIQSVRQYPQNVFAKINDYLINDTSRDHFLHEVEFRHGLVGPKDSVAEDWGIALQSLRCDVPFDLLSLENDNLRDLQEMRHLRCAIMITLSGVNQVTNCFAVPVFLQGKSVDYYYQLETALLELFFDERVDVETEIYSFLSFLASEWQRFNKRKEEKDRRLGFTDYDVLVIAYKAIRCFEICKHVTEILHLNFNLTDAEKFKAELRSMMDIARSQPTAYECEHYLDLEKYDWKKEDKIAKLLKLGNDRKFKAAFEEILEGKFRLSVPFNFPVAHFRDLVAIGRKEVEAYNDIRNRILFHVQSQTTKPLSIVVFGAPGNGKSFAVKQIAHEAVGERFIEVECNLSQGHGPDYLNRVFLKIADIIAKGKLPLVLFDEFDTALNGVQYGWLKYFLQPMQDGYFNHPDGSLSVGNSVFVFIGGTHKTYSTFASDARSKQHQAANQKELTEIDIKSAKLPDFVSRLRGFVNIPDVNAIDPTVSSSNNYVNDNSTVAPINSLRYLSRGDAHEIPFVRRAVLLRSMLAKKGMLRRSDYSLTRAADSGKAIIDMELLRAFLMVKEYRHGARSIEAILGVSAPFYNVVAKASLPIPEQLAMHTDSDDFEELLETPIDEMGNLRKDFVRRLRDWLTPSQQVDKQSNEVNVTNTLDKTV